MHFFYQIFYPETAAASLYKSKISMTAGVEGISIGLWVSPYLNPVFGKGRLGARRKSMGGLQLISEGHS